MAEQLAWGALMLEGNHVRISGQDVERGTFSHRHSVIHDQKKYGEKYKPLSHIDPSQESPQNPLSLPPRLPFRSLARTFATRSTIRPPAILPSSDPAFLPPADLPSALLALAPPPSLPPSSH